MPVSPAVPVPAETFAWFQVVVDALRAGDDDPGPALPDAPPALLLARGSSPALVDALASRPARLLVTGRGEPGPASLASAQAAVAEARSLAAARDGLVVDVVVPRVLTADAPTGRAATHWFVFEHDGTQVRTHGLARFGLPELWCGQSDEPRLPMYDAVLVGVAQRLVEEWPDRDPVGPATVTLRDVARGYGDASAGGDDPTLDRGVDLTLSYDDVEERLEVVLHDDPAAALFG